MQMLPVLPDYTPAAVPDFDREHWTTCHIQRLTAGDVFTSRTLQDRPAVVSAIRVEPLPGEEYGLTVATVRYLDDGETAEVKARANTSVLLRCDMHYTPAV